MRASTLHVKGSFREPIRPVTLLDLLSTFVILTPLIRRTSDTESSGRSRPSRRILHASTLFPRLSTWRVTTRHRLHNGERGPSKEARWWLSGFSSGYVPQKRGRRGEEETSEGAWCCRVIPNEKIFTMTYKSPATPAAECVCHPMLSERGKVKCCSDAVIIQDNQASRVRHDPTKYEWTRQGKQRLNLSRGIDSSDSG